MFGQNCVVGLNTNDITINNDNAIIIINNTFNNVLIMFYNNDSLKLLANYNYVASSIVSPICKSYYLTNGFYLNKIVNIKNNKTINSYDGNYNIQDLTNFMLLCSD